MNQAQKRAGTFESQGKQSPPYKIEEKDLSQKAAEKRQTHTLNNGGCGTRLGN
jgi:hypothetical protein